MKADVTVEEDGDAFSKKPVPTRFKNRDVAILSAANLATGYSNSELIRRAVRLMGRQHDAMKRYDFLLELTA